VQVVSEREGQKPADPIEAIVGWQKEPPEKRSERLDEIIQEFGPARTASAFFSLYKERLEDLAEFLATSNSLRPASVDVNCVGMYYYRLRNGGAERVVTQLAGIFVSMGYRVVLFSDEDPTADDYPYPQGVERITLPSMSSLDTHSERFSILEKAIQQHGIDFFIHHQWSNPIVFWDALVIKAAGAVCVVHCHGVFIYPVFNHGYRLLLESMPERLGFLDAVITLSRVDQLYWSAYNKRIYSVQNPQSFEKVEKAASAHHRDARKNLLWVGRFSYQKQYEDIIPIMKLVVNKMPDARLTVVGEGEESSTLESFRQRIEAAGLSENILPVGFQKDVHSYYADASVFLSTALFEGWPLTINEAMAYAVPVVAYDLPYLETFRDAQSVIKVERGDKERFAQMIIELLENESQYARASAQARLSSERLNVVKLKEVWRQIFSSFAETAHEDQTNGGEVDANNRGWDNRDRETLQLLLKTIWTSYKYDYQSPAERAEAEDALIRQVQDEVTSRFEHSISYRLGRALTWLPRRIKDSVHHKHCI
jgi:glycosyltransferase involved in cell wall biosynthesis